MVVQHHRHVLVGRGAINHCVRRDLKAGVNRRFRPFDCVRRAPLLLRRLPRDATKLCEDSVPFTSERFLFKTTSDFFKSHLGEFRIDDIDMAIRGGFGI